MGNYKSNFAVRISQDKSKPLTQLRVSNSRLQRNVPRVPGPCNKAAKTLSAHCYYINNFTTHKSHQLHNTNTNTNTTLPTQPNPT